jgi:hypothetical protein
MRRIFGTKTGEQIGSWGKPDKEKLLDLYSSLIITTETKLRSIRWAVNAV